MQREVLQNGGEVYEELHARQWFSQTQSASCVGGKAESGGKRVWAAPHILRRKCVGLMIMIEDITDTGGNETEVAVHMNAAAWVQLLYQNVTTAGDRTGG